MQAAAFQNPSLIRGVWRGRERAIQTTEPTGWTALNSHLPGDGWPVGSVTELICDRTGIGEFGLLMPLVARLTNAGKRVAFVAPPYLPYAHGLAGHGVKLGRVVLLSPESPDEALWAAEQTLRSSSFGLVAVWPKAVSDRDLRRLQLAAETGGAVAVLYRPRSAASQHSTAALRIAVSSSEMGLKLEILKNRGGSPSELSLPLLNDSTRFRKTGAGWA